MRNIIFSKLFLSISFCVPLAMASQDEMLIDQPTITKPELAEIIHPCAKGHYNRKEE